MSFRLHMRNEATVRVLSLFMGIADGVILDGGDINVRSLSECMESLAADRYRGKMVREHCGMLIKGKDAWGRPFVFGTRDGGATIEVTSLGGNGKWEDGEGDDLRVAIQRKPGSKQVQREQEQSEQTPR